MLKSGLNNRARYTLWNEGPSEHCQTILNSTGAGPRGCYEGYVRSDDFAQKAKLRVTS